MKSPYLKPGASSSTHLSNYVRYIATRTGAEQTGSGKQQLEATARQKKIAAELAESYPDTRELFEYQDYLGSPTRGNAEQYISRAAEVHPELFAGREKYVDYIATRPHVEKISSHGLFSDEGAVVSLNAAAEEVSKHQGNVWTHIISLRREDAQRLGYDTAEEWMTLLRSQRNMFAANMKISPENFRWYAAFHNEGSHPHVHMIAYSADPREAYLTRQGIENIKSSLASQIFRQDLISVYQKETAYRDELRRRSKELLEEMLRRISSGESSDPQLERMLVMLARRLKNTSGRKVYGYLKPDVKNLVNNIVDALARDERIAALYELWYEQRCEIIKTYTDTLPPKLPLSENKEFKPVKNAVIRAADELAHSGLFSDMVNGDESQRKQSSQSDSYSPHITSTVIRLLNDVSKILDDKIRDNDRVLSRTDSKERRRILEKMAAHGMKLGG